MMSRLEVDIAKTADQQHDSRLNLGCFAFGRTMTPNAEVSRASLTFCYNLPPVTATGDSQLNKDSSSFAVKQILAARLQFYCVR